jgi:hypothetical protein
MLRVGSTHKEIAGVLQQQGFNRTAEGVRKRSKALGLSSFSGEPSWPEDECLKDILIRVRGHVDRIASPPLPVPPSVKTALTTRQRVATNQLFEQLLEIRDEVERNGSGWVAREVQAGHTLVVLLSDFHVGKKVELGENGETYNVEIALERIDSIRDQVLGALQRDRLVNEVVFVLAGDLVDGEGIYPGQEMHLVTHVADQIKAVVKGLWKLIHAVHLQHSTHIVTCRGNHGRTNLSDEANWDNIIYQQLELLVDMADTTDKSITIKNLYGNYNMVDIRGWKGLVRHHAPPQADTAGAIAKFAGWYSIHEYDFMCYGHFHHWGVMTWNGKPLFRNGSLGGGDDYAEGFGASDDPTQLMFTISEEKLVENIQLLSL